MIAELPEITLGRPKNEADTRLIHCAQELLGAPFDWKHPSCFSIALACLDVQYGTGLLQWLDRQGDIDLKRAKAHAKVRFTRRLLLHLGMKPVDSGFMQRGAILLALDNDLECTHVYLGHAALTAGPDKGVHLIDADAVIGLTEAFQCPK